MAEINWVNACNIYIFHTGGFHSFLYRFELFFYNYRQLRLQIPESMHWPYRLLWKVRFSIHRKLLSPLWWNHKDISDWTLKSYQLAPNGNKELRTDRFWNDFITLTIMPMSKVILYITIYADGNIKYYFTHGRYCQSYKVISKSVCSKSLIAIWG
jgi:hypothetical protein